MAKKPLFVVFVRSPRNLYCRQIKNSLDEISKQIGKDVDFKYVFRNEEEVMSLAFNVYKSPMSFYITKEGIAHSFDTALLLGDQKKAINMLKNGIESSPMTFWAPAVAQNKKYVYYIIKDVRNWYEKSKMKRKFEKILRSANVTYLVDPVDANWSEKSIYSKMDKQIILLAIGLPVIC